MRQRLGIDILLMLFDCFCLSLFIDGVDSFDFAFIIWNIIGPFGVGACVFLVRHTYCLLVGVSLLFLIKGFSSIVGL